MLPKAAAAAAGVGSSDRSFSSSEPDEIDLSNHTSYSKSERNPSKSRAAKIRRNVCPRPFSMSPKLKPSSLAEDDGPKISVDPMMAGGGPAASSGTSFSEISELPPLKEVYIAPPPPPVTDLRPVKSGSAPATMYAGADPVDEKPKIQPREVAEKAIKEIKSVPPRLMLYSLAGAGALIVLIGIGMTIYIHSLGGSDDESGAPRSSVPVTTQAPSPQQAAAGPRRSRQLRRKRNRHPHQLPSRKKHLSRLHIRAKPQRPRKHATQRRKRLLPPRLFPDNWRSTRLHREHRFR